MLFMKFYFGIAVIMSYRGHFPYHFVEVKTMVGIKEKKDGFRFKRLLLRNIRHILKFDKRTVTRGKGYS